MCSVLIFRYFYVIRFVNVILLYSKLLAELVNSFQLGTAFVWWELYMVATAIDFIYYRTIV